VPINAALRRQLEQARQLAVSDYVVEYAGGTVPKWLRWPFRKLCQRAGLTWIPTPHHLKRSVASWLAMAGTPVDQAADYLATDPRTLRRVYRKFDPSFL
jgi:integrase